MAGPGGTHTFRITSTRSEHLSAIFGPRGEESIYKEHMMVSAFRDYRKLSLDMIETRIWKKNPKVVR